MGNFTNQDTANFALINDLTSFIQIGDITIHDYKNFRTGFIELKEGNVNDEIFNLLDEYSKNECDFYLYSCLKDKGENFENRFFRVVNQIGKNIKVSDTINTGNGIDMSTGLNVKIINEELDVDYFSETINLLLKKSKTNGYAINDVEKFSEQASYVWVKSLDIKTPIYDMKYSLSWKFNYPYYSN